MPRAETTAHWEKKALTSDAPKTGTKEPQETQAKKGRTKLKGKRGGDHRIKNSFTIMCRRRDGNRKAGDRGLKWERKERAFVRRGVLKKKKGFGGVLADKTCGGWGYMQPSERESRSK